jgi:psp operon transcriptional activator
MKTLIGSSPQFEGALARLRRAASVPRPVVIVGERGTGKELFAERLHYLSSRWEAPLVSLNCAAISETLMDAELFGFEKGAFTGATQRTLGRFERANGGSLFLDEIGTMSSRVQEKCLRAIEYGHIERLGGREAVEVDVRVIAATNEDLRQKVQQGEFRADLLDRLSFDVIKVPPLRDRVDDIEPLAEHFAVRISAELSRDLFPGFTREAINRLKAHAWPGNVRELKNVVERSVAYTPPDNKVEDILLDPFDAEARVEDDQALPPCEAEHRATPRPHDLRSTENASATATPAHLTFTDQVASFERELLQQALAANQYKLQETAVDLGLSYHQLRRLIKKHHI